jgi:hypothetical protein
MVDSQSLVARIESSNKGAGMMEVWTPMNLFLIHILIVKGNDLLAHMTRTMYQKKRYMTLEMKCSNFYNYSIVNDLVHCFRRAPLHVQVLKIICSLGGNNNSNAKATIFSPKAEQGIQSLNNMQEGIIKVMMQFPDGSRVDPKEFFPNGTMTVVFL